MFQTSQNQLLNYGLAILTVAIATALTLLIRAYLEPVNMALFFAAVAISAWRGGIGAGLAATALAALSISYFFITPINSLALRPGSLLLLSVFTLVALLISSLSAELRIAKRRTELSFKAQMESEEARQRLIEELESKQRQLETMLQQMPAAVVAASPSGRLLFMNQQVQQFVQGSVSSADSVEGYLMQQLAFYPDGRSYPAAEAPLVRSLQAGEVVVDEELSILCADGERRTVLASASPIRDAQGQIVSAVSVLYDITNRKQTEAALKTAKQEAQRRAYEAEEAERTLHLLLENVPEGITIVGRPPEFPILANSKYSEVLIGRASDALVGIPMEYHSRAYGLLLPDGNRPSLEQTPLYRATHSGETVANEEWLVQRSDGSRITALLQATPIRDVTGRIMGAITCWNDITDRKQAIEALRQSQARFQRLVANVPGMIYQYVMAADGSDTFTYVSPKSREIYECAPEDLHPSLIWEMTHAGDREQVSAAIAAANRDLCDLDVQFRVLLPSGRLKWLQVKSKPEPQSDGSVVWDGMVTDITDRKQAELELKQLNERFELAALAVNSLIYEVDLQSMRVERTQGLTQILGYTLAETEPTLEWWSDLIHPDDRQSHSEMNLTDLTDYHQYEYRVRHKDGHYRWVRDYGIIVKDAAGKPVKVVGSTTDITERKQFIEDLYQSEERYRYLAEAIPQLVWVTNSLSENEYVNQRYCDYTGLSAEQLLGKGWHVTVHPDDLERLERQWAAAIQQGLTTYETDYRLRRADGTYRWHLSRGVALEGDQGEIIRWFGTCTDIEIQKQLEVEQSDRLQLEQSSRQQAELENRTKDEFLATLSHEMRSPLMPVLGWAKLLQSNQYDEETMRQALEIIERNAKLQVQLVEDLLDATRTKIQQPDETAQPTSQLLHSPSALSNIHILAVDDDADMRNLLQFVFQQHEGAKATIVSSASEVLQVLQQSQPDVLICDISMPDIDGYMLIQEIRALPPEQGGQIPAIALTAYAGEVTQQQTLAAGFQLHLAKPVDLNRLVQAILEITEHK
ncbi:PAS domain S-box protein [Phormidium tenue FACHB-886]|nr:PAS domain S-box protein [Phormidium tenue FACHB-886]